MTDQPRKSKPYPWKCVECGQRTIYPVTEPYESIFIHEGVMHDFKMDSLDYAKCQNCGAIALETEPCQAITSHISKLAAQINKANAGGNT